MAVDSGDRVKLGQLLYTDKRNPTVRFTSPGSGVVSAIHRGERRVLQSVVVDLDGSEEETFPSFNRSQLDRLEHAEAVDVLISSGLWTAFRTRPFGRIPAPDSSPRAMRC